MVVLSSGCSSRAKAGTSLYLIGDPKQAIYGFRGADVLTYLEARDRVEQAGSPRVPLIQNFRSTPDLIDAYNHILDPSADPPFFDGDDPLRSNRSRRARSWSPKRLTAHRQCRSTC